MTENKEKKDLCEQEWLMRIQKYKLSYYLI